MKRKLNIRLDSELVQLLELADRDIKTDIIIALQVFRHGRLKKKVTNQTSVDGNCNACDQK